MLLVINDVLNAADLAQITTRVRALKFVDGGGTAGWHSKLVKNNLQVDRTQPEYAPLNKTVSETIMRNPQFALAARPRQMTPLLFNCYRGGGEYGTHVDDPVMYNLRSDVSFTLFLADPATYEGGELVVETTAGEQSFKLENGALIVYPSAMLHRVMPVTTGERLAAVGWCQSYVRDAARREILYDLDIARRGLFEKQGKTREFDLISRSHANLVRMWADG